MKKLISGALILALTIGAAQAQKTSDDSRQGYKKEQKMAYDDLNLTSDQKAKLKSIRQDYQQKMNDLKKQDQLTVAEMKNRRQSLHQQFQSQFESILTPAQKDQLAQKKTETKGKGGKHGFNRNGQERGNREGRFQKGDMQKELNLTPDQQDRMTQIRSEYKSKFEALRNDNSLSQEQKKGKMHDLMQQQQQQMKQVLTQEQLQKMQSLRKQKEAGNL